MAILLVTSLIRLYNPFVEYGDHHYTTDSTEAANMTKADWELEGTGWYSDPNQQVKVHRQYNPFTKTGTHNYTTSKTENDNLKKAGCEEEGIGWYGR